MYIMLFSKKDLSYLIFPLIIEQFLVAAVGMADAVMVASCGEAAVSGISLVDSINILFITIFSALATGGAIVTSQYIGKNDGKNANLAAWQLILITTTVALGIMSLGLVFRNPILYGVFGSIDANVMTNSQIYFFWTVISFPFLGIYNAGAALFRAMGNSKVPMLISALVNLINVAGNAILIFGFSMGVAGAAISTLIARGIGAVIILLLLRFRPGKIKITSLIDFRFRGHMIKNILGVGIPNGLENSMFQIGKILLQSLVATFGTAAMAANAVGGNIALWAQIPGNAISLAMVPIIGQCIGAGETKQATHYAKKLLITAYIAMGVLQLLNIVFVNQLVGIFNLTPETSALTVELLIVSSVMSIIFWPASFTLPNALRAAGDVKFTMIVSIISMWIFRIAFGYILGLFFNMGVMGTWIAMTIDWAVRCICFLIRTKSGKWLTKKLV